MTSRNIEPAINLIMEFEGFSSTPYLCPAGVLTIAYGHTGGVKLGDRVTKEQGLELLKLDLRSVQDILDIYNTDYHWTDNEYCALLSFGYNLGSHSITQLTNYGHRDKKTIAQKMTLYVYANGEILPGLVRRREKERELFLTPDSSGLQDEKIIFKNKED